MMDDHNPGGALTIAAVTLALKGLLENWVVESGVAARLGDVAVSALPPDRITTGADERSQLNIFMYRVMPRTAWRGEPTGTARPSLALDLHYLLTAYGAEDFHAEVLLGCGVQLLHATPVLTSAMIREALATAPPASTGTVLIDPALLAGVGDIRLLPEFPGPEEQSRLWSALQARYRPSVAYRASSVAIAAP
jgi:hypothetical protein